MNYQKTDTKEIINREDFLSLPNEDQFNYFELTNLPPTHRIIFNEEDKSCWVFSKLEDIKEGSDEYFESLISDELNLPTEDEIKNFESRKLDL